MTHTASPFVITWVVMDNYSKRIYKYQEREAGRCGFVKVGRIMAKHYASQEAAYADAENIKAAYRAINTRRTGRHTEGQGCLISDHQFGKMNLAEPQDVWTSRGVEKFNEIITR